MKTGEIILFSTVAALAAALVLTAKVVDDDIDGLYSDIFEEEDDEL